MAYSLLKSNLLILGLTTLAFSSSSVFANTRLAFEVADERESRYAANDTDQTVKKYKSAKKVKSSGGGFATSRPATGRKVFIFNPRALRWAVYDESGQLVRTGHGVGGRHYCPDVKRGCKTPSGTFRVVQKAGANFKSSRYPVPRGGAPMPYAMFFTKNYAIHGSNSVPNFNASHGCVRVYPADARWLNTSFLNHGSTVIVYSY